jgi:hypothetical protein
MMDRMKHSILISLHLTELFSWMVFYSQEDQEMLLIMVRK